MICSKLACRLLSKRWIKVPIALWCGLFIWLVFNCIIFVLWPSDIQLSQTQQDNSGLCDFEVLGEEAVSALKRAHTAQCRLEIFNTSCLVRLAQEKLYPPILPHFCPLSDLNKAGNLIGCFRDSSNKRLLTGAFQNLSGVNTPQLCQQLCFRFGFPYAGVEYGKECFCGSTLPDEAFRVGHDQCSSACSGDPTESCGGYWRLAVYHTGFVLKNLSSFLIRNVQPVLAQRKRVKILFILVVNGRAHRHILRLLRNIYRSHHFYFIHVDKRRTYLYDSLRSTIKSLPQYAQNVYVTENRWSSIWGGASLLQMYLSIFNDLFTLPHFNSWDWDYIINYSESDFPLRPIEDLQEFFSTHLGRNFLRSHHIEPEKFLRKQGLHKVFYECENRLWRLGDRNIPLGVYFTGGSDWFALHRDFVQYAVFGKDKLVIGLKALYKYALLPAESFFHTLLLNSPLCETWVDANLKFTNWKRDVGCKCQYKHIVDWCGCSPKVFEPEDLSRISRPVIMRAGHFSGRKFEPIISQEIISTVERDYLHQDSLHDEVNFDAYWQNEWSRQELQHLQWTPQRRLLQMMAWRAFREFFDAYTLADNFAHECPVTKLPNDWHCFQSALNDISLFDPLDLFVHKRSDRFEGLVLKSLIHCTSDKTIEMLIKPVEFSASATSFSSLDFLQDLKVSTNFDPKEKIFRNWIGDIYTDSSPVLRIAVNLSAYNDRFQENAREQLELHWIAPDEKIKARFILPKSLSSSVNTVSLFPASETHNGTGRNSLMSGIWKIRITSRQKTLAETAFPVFPGSSSNLEKQTDTSMFNYELLVPTFYEAKLLCYDGLNRAFRDSFNAMQTCLNYKTIFKKVPLSCSDVLWSSMSPDPKSDFVSIFK